MAENVVVTTLADVQTLAAKIKKVSGMVRIDLGYSCQLLVPAQKAGPVIAMLADCMRAQSEYFSGIPGVPGRLILVLAKEEIPMAMGTFEVMTKEDHKALVSAISAYEASPDAAE